MPVNIDGKNLSIKDVYDVSRAHARVRLDPEVRRQVDEKRSYIEKTWLTDESPLIYSFNTGSGAFKDKRVSVQDMEELQVRTIYAHAAGVGESFPEEVSRAIMLMRVNAIATNAAGYRTQIADRLIDFLNAGLHPVIQQQGSVGASGDLAPGALMASAVCGYDGAEIIYKGRRMPAAKAIAAAGLPVKISLGAKDAAALLGGCAASAALAALAIHDTRSLTKIADIALALSMEAMRAELAAFDPRLHRARPHPGQELVARNVLRILDGTKRCGEAARSLIFPDEARDPGTAPSPRVQDVYSLRCAPQVHGPVRDATEYIEGIVCREMNSSQDNPVFASDELGGYVPLAGGHFHGQYLAQTMDLLGIALADIGAISERRLARLIEPTMSYGLPRNLASGQPGLNGGYAVVQCSMSALVMENRHLAAPGSVDSIPSKGNVEDHVSNSTWCGRKARTIVGNTQQIIGVELLLAAQALTMVENLGRNYPIGAGSKAALDAIREVIPAAMDGDRLFSLEMKKVLQLVQSGSVLSRVEEVVGCLE